MIMVATDENKKELKTIVCFPGIKENAMEGK